MLDKWVFRSHIVSLQEIIKLKLNPYRTSGVNDVKDSSHYTRGHALIRAAARMSVVIELIEN